MKKTIIFILCTFLFMPDIYSKTFTNELPLNKSIIITSVEERYKWYKLKKVNEHYENAVKHNCEYFDEVENNFSEWNLVKPDEKEGRTIEEKVNIIDLSDEKYNTILIDNFIVEFLELKSIVITDNSDKNIAFELAHCINCTTNEAGNLILNKDSKIFLNLNNFHTEVPQVEIRFEKTNNILYFKSTLLVDYKYPVKSKGITTLGGTYKTCSTYYCSYKITSLYTWDEMDNYEEKYYRFKDSYVNCYSYEKEYFDGYFTYLNEYIKDENTKTYFYEYKTVESEIIYKNIYNNKNNEEIKPAYNEDEVIAINYGNKKTSEDYSKLPVFIIALGGILILLILICRKISINLKNSR